MVRDLLTLKLSWIGLVDEGETPEQAAIRELEEETGVTLFSVFFYLEVLLRNILICRVQG
jgi:8-oxo-dGTP pyrophosphatase MutT (NUDIX family)